MWPGQRTTVVSKIAADISGFFERRIGRMREIIGSG